MVLLNLPARFPVFPRPLIGGCGKFREWETTGKSRNGKKREISGMANQFERPHPFVEFFKGEQ